MENEELYKLKK